MADHRVYDRVRVFSFNRDAGMTLGEYTEYFIGEALSYRLHVAEVQFDLAELLQVRKQPFRFGAGDVIPLMQFDEPPRLAKLEVIFFGGKFVENIFQPPGFRGGDPGEPLQGDSKAHKLIWINSVIFAAPSMSFMRS